MELARQRSDIEIISVDSMAVYREMDLATAKPPRTDRTEIPHHLIDVLDPAEECTVSWFQSMAQEAIAEIRARGKVPVLVGGTGLYHRAVVDNLEIPGQFPEVRAHLEAIAADPEGPAILMARLHELDPVAAERIEPGNVRRTIRALEVIDGTGRPFSSFGPGMETYGASTVVQVGLNIELGALGPRFEERITTWMDAGLLDEVASLAKRPNGLSRTARQAIGYRELLAVIEDGAPLEPALAATLVRTRVFARRQRSWFRRDPRVHWVAPRDAMAHATEVLERIVRHREARD